MVTTDVDPSPLPVNPTLAQIRAHEEEKLKKDTKITDLETPKLVWDKLQGEFEGSNKVKSSNPCIEKGVRTDEDERC